MGIGDAKPKFIPRHKKIRCARCGNEYIEVAVRRCNNPVVHKSFGEAYICVYCCKRKPCPFLRTEHFSGACSCELYIREETANGG